MAIVVLQDFPGGTAAQYDQVSQMLNLGGKSPKGNLFHVAGPVEGGWRVVDVWESPEALSEFMGKLGPLAQQAGIAQPQVTTWPVHTMLTPQGYGLGG